MADEISISGVAVPTNCYINGQWLRAAGNKRFTVTSPATGEVIAQVADGQAGAAQAALDAACNAQSTWATSSAQSRSTLLMQLYEQVVAHRTEIAKVATAEMGRPLRESLAEVDYGAAFLSWFATQALTINGESRIAPKGNFEIQVRYVPVGPALLITPWNFPFAMITRKLGAAIAAGCTVIIKPAAQTPCTAAVLVALVDDLDVPPGVVNMVPTSDAAAQSRLLMADKRLRKVSFTGSTAAGRVLIGQSAGNIQRVSMELGGNAAFIVLDDADVNAAVEGAMQAKFRNGGQSCVAANQFLVDRTVVDEFLTKLTTRVSALTVGDGARPEVDIGPMIDARQLARVTGLVDDARERGATVVCGGEPSGGRGYFYKPTILTDIPAHARVLNEEVFGPVVPIRTIGSAVEAIQMANASDYGLANFVYSKDLQRARRVGSKLESGMVGINRGLVSEPGAPFGGIKASGLGREGGYQGVYEYLEPQYMALDAPIDADAS